MLILKESMIYLKKCNKVAKNRMYESEVRMKDARLFGIARKSFKLQDPEVIQNIDRYLKDWTRFAHDIGCCR